MPDEPAPVYSSTQDVIRFCGASTDDLKLDTDAELEQLIHGWLVEIKDLIDHDRNRDYHAEVEAGKRDQVPPGIHGIARELAAKTYRLAIQTQTAPVVNINDFTVRLVGEDLLTPDIRRQLSRYPRKPLLRMGVIRSRAGEG